MWFVVDVGWALPHSHHIIKTHYHLGNAHPTKSQRFVVGLQPSRKDHDQFILAQSIKIVELDRVGTSINQK